MKKILLQVLWLALPMAMFAGTTIYSGSQSIDWGASDGYVTISSDKFSSLNVADEIVFNITYVEGQEWPQVGLYDGEWNSLPGAGNTAISAETTQVVYYATTAMISVLQTSGMVVTGCGYTLNRVEIIPTDSDDDMSGAIWIGNVVMGSDWSNYATLPASCFTDAEEGLSLHIHYKDLGAGAYLSLRNSDWNDLADAEGVTPEGTYTAYTITADMLSELQSGGLIATGTSYTLTYVDYSDPNATPAVTGSVSVTDNWIYENGTTPTIEVKVTNSTDEEATATVKVEVTTDKYEAVTSLSQSVTVEAGKVATVPMEIEGLDAGFYRLTVTVDDELARAFVIGVDPEKVVSEPDAQDDFDSFWAEAKQELAQVEMNAVLTKIDDKTTSDRTVYLVEMYSLPDEAGGEPGVIRAYYAEPVADGKYPALINYQGYDSGGYDMWCMGGSDLPGWCELSLATRGQLLNNREPNENTYGDWFQYNFGDKDTYYYRGAYMDVLRAIDFVCSREKTDTDNLFAEGQSQGGAFTYAAAALSDYPLNAVAPAIPFMGDFPDYFDLASWPANVARQQQAALGMSDEEMFEFLSYFDTKNLAPKVSAPVIQTIGLADTTCPPHTNMAPYNNLPSGVEKQISYNPLLGHEVPSSWYNTYMDFFKAHLTTAGISNVASALPEKASARYNLSGQRVSSGYKGIVVENGKKALVK
ncbi:MAG: acetylxylan esterase [Prevotella sp.]|nr:acetylxylan esterase [Prevotella sp.]